MKKILVLVLLILILAGGIGFWWITNTSSPSSVSQKQRFIITKGASVSEIAAKLESQKLIKSKLVFKIYTQIANIGRKLQAGEYSLAENLDLQSLINVILKGPTQVWVTIPEGLRREEIAEKFSDFASFDKAEFMNLTQDQEGFLFPDTYLFPKDVKASLVVSTLTNTFDKKYKEKVEPLAKNSDLTQAEIVNLAAILERETLTETEKPIVAGILIKRLNANWPLQADATVQYALGKPGKWWEPVTRDDYQLNSKFNTYRQTGLPPSPIANPGVSSMVAVAAAEDSPYWFYIHDTKGAIHYAKTLEEHNENIAKYLR